MQVIQNKIVWGLVVALVALFLGPAPVAQSATITVTNTNDSGAGSLRQAILDSNASSGTTDTIEFSITGTGPHTIALSSALPIITDPVIIDGTSEPDWAAGAPVVVLDGTSAGTDGLNITAGNSTVKGLVINNFSGDGIELSTNGGNTIESTFIGTDETGTLDSGNGGHGILISSDDNVVGGGTPPACPPEPCTPPATLNVIAFNGGDGVFVDSGGERNTITGNNFFDNVGQGIDLFPDGQTDPPFAGTLTSALYSNGRTVFTGFIHDAPPGVHLYIDFFVSPSCDTTGYGEGKTWIAGGETTDPTTDPEGDVGGSAAPMTVASTVGDHVTGTVTVPDGTTYEFSNCVEVQPDTDNDMIEDDIDGYWDGSSYVSLATTPSNWFTDIDQPATTTPTLGDLNGVGPGGRNDCLVSVVDMPAPDGVMLGVNCALGDGPATITACTSPVSTIILERRTSAMSTCGSIKSRVDIGPVILNFGTIPATLPSNTTSAIIDLGGGSYQILNAGGSARSINAGGRSIAPGQAVTVSDGDSDGLVDTVDICPADPDCDDDEVSDGPSDPDGGGAIVAGPDNCPSDANPGQENVVHPGTPDGDHCEDPEPDSVVDYDDNCPDDANTGQENTDADLGTAIPPATFDGVPIGDADGDECDNDDDDDGYSDATEAGIGTTAVDNCTNSNSTGPGPNTDAFPSDMNKDDVVAINDVTGPFAPHFGAVEFVDPTGTNAGDYNPRVDLNQDGVIAINDITGPFAPDFGKICT